MSSPPHHHLPTLDRLHASVPSDLDTPKIASEWFAAFTASLESANVDAILSLLLQDSFWKDTLSLTWDFRTIFGSIDIRRFLQNRIADAKLKDFRLESAEFAQLSPNLVWIQGLFAFGIGDLGAGVGVFRIVPTSTGEWKGHCIFTCLEELKAFPEKAGPLRDSSNHGYWEEKREQEQAFEGIDPYVLVVGGGQCGLEIAARLKFLDVPTLIIEKAPRIGNVWRNRYEVLCTNDPVWCDHLSYIPFPRSWPVYTPAKKLADWLEFYARSLDLDIWLSSTVTSIRKDPKTDTWNVVVRKANGQERIFHPTHVVLAVGMISPAHIPEVPGKEDFEGEVLHSTQYRTARSYLDRKVVVVGAGTSGHDISEDCVKHGIDVTMYQRSPVYVMSAKEGFPRLLGPYQEGGPPTAIADRVGASFPIEIFKLIAQRLTNVIAEADKMLLDGLRNRGFKLNLGTDDGGILLTNLTRSGGYYTDQGASQLIVNGKIKLKSDSILERFTKNGLKFEDGSELEADVVVYATGFENLRDSIRVICGDDITDRLKELGGLDEECQIRSFWRDSGVQNLWFMAGSLADARYHSNHLALQIKAIKEGLFGTRYSL